MGLSDGHPIGIVNEKGTLKQMNGRLDTQTRPWRDLPELKRRPSLLSPGVERSDRDADGNPVPKWKYYYARFMLLWAVTSHAFGLIQAIEIYQSKNASGVSLAAWSVYIASSIIWIIYGAAVLARRNLVIVTSSSIGVTLGTIIVIGIILYGNNPSSTDCEKHILKALQDYQRSQDKHVPGARST